MPLAQPVFCDQVEYHPFLGQEPLLELARERDVLVTAYSRLAHGRVPGDETLTEIGERTARPPARWRCGGCSISPASPRSQKASPHERRVESFEVFDFTLSDDQRARIDALPKDDRQIDPDFGPDWDAASTQNRLTPGSGSARLRMVTRCSGM